MQIFDFLLPYLPFFTQFVPQLSLEVTLFSRGTERFHCSHHTVAMLLIDKGIDIYTIAALLGHRQVSSTQNYAKMTSKKMIEAIVKME